MMNLDIKLYKGNIKFLIRTNENFFCILVSVPEQIIG